MASLKTIDKDRGWNKIKEQMRLAKKSFVNVGVLSDAGKYQPHSDLKTKRTHYSSANIADVATFNEFGHLVRGGSYFVVPRPFMRTSYDEGMATLMPFIAFNFGKIMDGKLTTEQALKKIGTFHKGQIQKKIASGPWAPNAPSTIKSKRSKKPLIDSGQMRQSISFEVKLK